MMDDRDYPRAARSLEWNDMTFIKEYLNSTWLRIQDVSNIIDSGPPQSSFEKKSVVFESPKSCKASFDARKSWKYIDNEHSRCNAQKRFVQRRQECQWVFDNQRRSDICRYRKIGRSIFSRGRFSGQSISKGSLMIFRYSMLRLEVASNWCTSCSWSLS